MTMSAVASYSDVEHGDSNPLGDACDSEYGEQICGAVDEEDAEEEIEEEIEEEVEVGVEEDMEVFEEDYLNSDIDGEDIQGDVENDYDYDEDLLEELNDNLSDSLVEHEDNQNDVTQHMEFEQHTDLLGDGKLEQSCVKNEDPEISGQSKPIAATEKRCQESDREHAGSMEKERVIKTQNVEPILMNVDLSKNEITVADTGNPCVDSEIGLAPVPQTSKNLAEASSSVLNYEEEIKQMDIQFEEEIKRRSSRSVTPLIRPRSLSPDAVFSDGNKRPAAICEFFSKGWCIKGSSCLFLHRKEDLTDNNSKHRAVENHKRKLEVDEGPRDIIEGSRLSRSPSTGNRTSSSHPSPQSIARTKNWHQYNEKTTVSGHQREDLTSGVTHVNGLPSLSNDDPRLMSSFNDAERECQRQLRRTNDYVNFPVPKSGLMPWCGSHSADTGISLANYQSKGLPPYVERRTDLASTESQYNSDNYVSPVFGAHLDSTKNLHRLSNTLPGREYQTVSLPQRSSPFSDAEHEPLNVANYSRVLLNSAYTTNAFSNDWEPSVPFRPSLFLPPLGPSSLENQYDPLRDSIEHHIVGSNSSNIFLSGNGLSIQSMVDSGANGDKHSFQEFQYNNTAQFEKDLFGTIAGVGESSIAEMDNKKAVPNEGMQFVSVNNINGFSDYRHRSGRARHKEFKVDRDTQFNSVYIDNKADGGDGLKELKALRYFRAALVDFVKELVKPIWREGHLSKDAHKLIVKKAVDKVLSTLQDDQIPSSVDAVKQYLSLSRHKVLKLVEGYAEKYGKF